MHEKEAELQSSHLINITLRSLSSISSIPFYDLLLLVFQ